MSLRRIRHRVRSYARRFTSLVTRAERRRFLLLWAAAAPAVVVTITIILLLALLTSSTARQDNWYAQSAIRAMVRDDAATARLCYASLLQRYPDNQQYQFGLAMALLRLGDPASAATLIQNLAPENKDGYMPAHLYVAEQLLAAENPSAEILGRAETHLVRFLKADPKNPKANALLGAVYSEQGRWEEASPLLALAGPTVGEMGLVAAEQLAKRGNYADATAWVRRAITFYSSKVEKDPKDVDSRVKLAQAHLMLRDYVPAIEVLHAGWKETQQPVFARGIGHAYGLWIASMPTMDAARRLVLTETGLKWDGQNEMLLRSVLTSEMKDAAAAVVATTQAVDGAALRALVAAVTHARATKPQQARAELSLALALGGEGFASIAANLGCIWAYSDAADRAAAGLLTEALLELRATDPIAVRAHGLVLARNGKLPEATELLERAVSSMSADAIIHEALADAYQELGKTDLAATHRALAAPSTQPSSANPPTPATQPTTPSPATSEMLAS